MKKLAFIIHRLILMAGMLALPVCLGACSNKVEVVIGDRLPAPAEEFIAKWFPGQRIARKTVSESGASATLSGGTQLEFDTAGAWRKIEDRINAIPVGIVAGPIEEYLSEHYPDDVIRMLEHNAEGYSVGLDSEVIVRFSEAQIFIEVASWVVVDTEVDFG